MSYTKLFASLLTSTIWTEDDKTRIVWITLLALADKNGEVTATIPGLAKLASVPIKDCERAIQKFLSPDKYSRTKDDEGRRIEQIDGGWSLLNHAKYRELSSREEQKTAAAARQQRYRDRKSRNVTDSDGDVTKSDACVTPSNGSVTHTLHIAEAEAEAEAESIERGRRPGPCTVEEAWRFAQSTGLGITYEGIQFWYDTRADAQWLIHRNNGTSQPIEDWRSNLRISIPWVVSALSKRPKPSGFSAPTFKAARQTVPYAPEAYEEEDFFAESRKRREEEERARSEGPD